MMLVENDLAQYAEAKKLIVEEYLSLLDLRMKEAKQKQKQQENG